MTKLRAINHKWLMEMRGFRCLRNEEIDALHQAAVQVVESLRDDHNTQLTLGPVMDDGQEAIVSRLEGLNRVDDIGWLARRLKKAFPDSRLAAEKNADDTVGWNLVLSKYVEDTLRSDQDQYSTDSGGVGVGGRPSGERAMFLLLLLGVAVALLFAQLG
jgi:hypothetical protein